ncbi:MAG: hypothetical protein BTN85_1242 [Candidatus Methanohalarchaeum thermophilum]|uniref:Uncharacterized protein n=1 Tax=Methanohalarchaeum thermophilum TaxID=1903181 RepID=A0A1Q6DWM3_METT1|nr:MAG: hypothetical protein BTN85_1242 [Candidatus Methanohalarchaeum thermophilum]
MDAEEIFKKLSKEETPPRRHDLVLVNGTKKLVLEKHRITETGIRCELPLSNQMIR